MIEETNKLPVADPTVVDINSRYSNKNLCDLTPTELTDFLYFTGELIARQALADQVTNSDTSEGIELVKWRLRTPLTKPEFLDNINANKFAPLLLGAIARGCQVAVNWDELTSLKSQVNTLTKYLRNNYWTEICNGEHGRFADSVQAAIHYMSIERGRWSRLARNGWHTITGRNDNIGGE